MVAVIDYDAGNIKSVEKALVHLGADVVVTREPEKILNADKVILPGVGAFGDAMEKINGYGLGPVIHEVVDKGTPFLGICLGLQLMFESSEENPGVEGLSLLKGKIVRLPEGDDRKIPHMGWNSLSFPSHGRLFQEIPEGTDVYFVHSYYLPVNPYVKAVTHYGVEIGASVEKENLFACQFHPEKSGMRGLKILENFLKL